jgi:hypothetical protein
MDVDIEKQKQFIIMLRDGKVMSTEEIEDVFDVECTGVFVADIVIRTGLDIRHGVNRKGLVYYIVNDVRQEEAGLEEMYVATEELLTDTEEVIEWREGHYAMWVCSNKIASGEVIADGDNYCGKFHKVDLGDEALTSPKTVQCVQCGCKYQIRPKGWK